MPPPRVVYSAIIYSKQKSPVQCIIIWNEPSNRTLQSDPFTIKSDSYFLINETTINMGTWTAYRIIQQIRCGNLTISAPFEKVNSPSKNWVFRVERNKIVSVGPSSNMH